MSSERWDRGLLVTKDSVAKRLAVSISLMALVSPLASIRFSGFWPTCTSNILFYRGSARFSDLWVLLTTSASSDPYANGFEYPPGSLPLIRFFESIWREAPPQTGIVWLYNATGSAVPQDPMQSCLTEPLLWAHLALVSCGLVAVVMLMYWLFSAGYGTSFRWTVALVSGAVYLLAFSALEMYSAVLFVSGCWALIGLWLIRKGRRIPTAILLVPLIATAYPIVFGVDRGNLDVVILPLLVAFAVIMTTSQRRSTDCLAAAFLGVAVAIKLWPVFLIGALFRRRARWEMLAAFSLSLVAVTLLGTNVVSDRWIQVGLQFVDVFSGSGSAVTSNWNLAFNYTWGAGLSYLVVMTGGQEALDSLRPLWLGIQQFLILMAPILAAMVFFLRRPFWQLFALASSLFLVLTSFAPPYRVTILVIAAGLMVRHFRLTGQVPQRLDLLVATFLGLSIAPTYLWTLPGITPLGVAPSGTLIGAIVLLTLTGLLIARVLRRSPAVMGIDGEESSSVGGGQGANISKG